jgi:hypothetical protein
MLPIAPVLADLVERVLRVGATKGGFPVKTYVIYRYQASGSFEAEDIKAETWNSRSPQEVLNLIPSQGDTLTLRSDYPEEYGEAPKEYKVLECHYGSTQWRHDLRSVTNIVLIIVTDLEGH